jgi:tRNA (cytidine/uridine-2'-O-)-methyltransferase
MRLTLFQPDIPQNVGAILRLAACLGAAVDLIEPCGFVVDDRRLRRAGMDYIDHVSWQRYESWERYQQIKSPGRLILLSSKASISYADFAFRSDDSLLLGQESAGVPELVRDVCDAAVTIPLNPGLRSLNVALAAAIVLAEALRQTQGLPQR